MFIPILATLAFCQAPITFANPLLTSGSSSLVLHMTENLDSGNQADVDASYTEKVKPGNDKQLTIAYQKFGVNAGGMDIPAPIPEDHVVRFIGQGVISPEDLAQTGSLSRLTPDLILNALYQGTYSLGTTSLISWENSLNGNKATINGTAKLELIANGEASVSCQLSYSATGLETPLKLQAKVTLQSPGGRLLHAEGSITSVPASLAGRYHVVSADFTFKVTS